MRWRRRRAGWRAMRSCPPWAPAARRSRLRWDGHDGMSLGEFLCEIDEHGTVEGYSGPGMFSGSTTLKALPFKSQLLTISLHKVDVKPGKTMLVGYQIKDAAQASGQGGTGTPSPWQTTPNGEIPVEGWEIFVPNVIGLNGSEPAECVKIIDSPDPGRVLSGRQRCSGCIAGRSARCGRTWRGS